MNINIKDTLLAVSPTSFGRPELESTGKILLPESLLNRIVQAGFNQQIMLFLLRNPHSQQEIGAGVDSFTSDRASAVIPKWMMKFINISEKDQVQISLQKFPTGTSVIFQPFKNEFYSLPNYRVILEYCLRQIPCFTQGSVLPINFHHQVYEIKVLKVEPQKIVSCFHADISTDFAAALDTFELRWGDEEEEYLPPSERAKKNSGNPVFQGVSHSLK